MQTITMAEKEFSTKTVVVLKFGPATSTDGMRTAEYYQVTIDPDMASPSGEFIRFGKHPGDEILGWQRIAALTVVEILGEWKDEIPPTMKIGKESVTFRSVADE